MEHKRSYIYLEVKNCRKTNLKKSYSNYPPFSVEYNLVLLSQTRIQRQTPTLSYCYPNGNQYDVITSLVNWSRTSLNRHVIEVSSVPWVKFLTLCTIFFFTSVLQLLFQPLLFYLAIYPSISCWVTHMPVWHISFNK